MKAESIAMRFPGQPELFKDITFTLTPGELTAIVGPSGSGKSTLLTMLAGWTKPTSGRIVRQHADSMTWVPQNPYGSPRRSALDHVCLPLLATGMRRREAEAAARSLLADFGLLYAEGNEFRRLSGGEAQRLMLARAAAQRAKVVLVDEPTAQLDPVSATTVIDVVERLADSERIVAVATHDPRVAARCSRVINLASERHP